MQTRSSSTAAAPTASSAVANLSAATRRFLAALAEALRDGRRVERIAHHQHPFIGL
jgi:hypothetical protein